jgi:hypothetical protein
MQLVRVPVAYPLENVRGVGKDRTDDGELSSTTALTGSDLRVEARASFFGHTLQLWSATPWKAFPTCKEVDLNLSIVAC